MELWKTVWANFEGYRGGAPRYKIRRGEGSCTPFAGEYKVELAPGAKGLVDLMRIAQEHCDRLNAELQKPKATHKVVPDPEGQCTVEIKGNLYALYECFDVKLLSYGTVKLCLVIPENTAVGWRRVKLERL